VRERDGVPEGAGPPVVVEVGVDGRLRPPLLPCEPGPPGELLLAVAGMRVPLALVKPQVGPVRRAPGGAAPLQAVSDAEGRPPVGEETADLVGEPGVV